MVDRPAPSHRERWLRLVREDESPPESSGDPATPAGRVDPSAGTSPGPAEGRLPVASSRTPTPTVPPPLSGSPAPASRDARPPQDGPQGRDGWRPPDARPYGGRPASPDGHDRWRATQADECKPMPRRDGCERGGVVMPGPAEAPGSGGWPDRDGVVVPRPGGVAGYRSMPYPGRPEPGGRAGLPAEAWEYGKAPHWGGPGQGGVLAGPRPEPVVRGGRGDETAGRGRGRWVIVPPVARRGRRVGWVWAAVIAGTAMAALADGLVGGLDGRPAFFLLVVLALPFWDCLAGRVAARLAELAAVVAAVAAVWLAVAAVRPEGWWRAEVAYGLACGIAGTAHALLSRRRNVEP